MVFMRKACIGRGKADSILDVFFYRITAFCNGNRRYVKMLKGLCYRRGIERYILSPCNKRRGKRFNAVARTSGAAMRERIAVTGLPCADGKGAYQSLETSKGFSSSGYVTMSERNASSSNRKASTTSGSNCVPRPSTMMFLAVSWSKAGLYTRLEISAS